MNVSALLKEAKVNSIALKTCPTVYQGYLDKITSLNTQYTSALALVAANYAKYKAGDDSTTYGNNVAQLAAIEAEILALTETINTSIVGLKKITDDTAVQMDNISTAQENLALGDPDQLDSTSRRTMLDFADRYRLAYYVVWAKVVLIIALLYFMFSTGNVILSVAVAVAITLIWYVSVFLLALYRGRNPRGGATTEGKLCGDGVTPSDETGSNCPAVCTSDTYVACNKGVHETCCWDGTPFNGEACTAAPPDGSCFNSTYGCCSDGMTERMDPMGTYVGNVDKYNCPVVADCKTSEFGCCPNGTARTTNDDECTFQSPCAFSAFGCCSDGTEKTDPTGANCGSGYI